MTLAPRGRIVVRISGCREVGLPDQFPPARFPPPRLETSSREPTLLSPAPLRFVRDFANPFAPKKHRESLRRRTLPGCGSLRSVRMRRPSVTSFAEGALRPSLHHTKTGPNTTRGTESDSRECERGLRLRPEDQG